MRTDRQGENYVVIVDCDTHDKVDSIYRACKTGLMYIRDADGARVDTNLLLPQTEESIESAKDVDVDTHNRL